MTKEERLDRALQISIRAIGDAISTMRKRSIMPYEELLKEMEYREAQLEHVLELIDRNILTTD